MARFKQESEALDYKDYVCRSLQLIPQRAWITRTFAELEGRTKIDDRTGEEIADDIMNRAGLKYKEEE